MILKKGFLLLVSVLCYAYIVRWKIFILLLLAAVVVLTDHIHNRSLRKLSSTCVVLLLVVGFVFFKGLNGGGLFVGYSVFAFTGISFLVDQYKEKKEYMLVDTLLYLFFFPKMLAGPLVGASEFIPQLSCKRTDVETEVYQGLKMLVYGMFIKFMVADGLLGAEPEVYGVNLLLQSFVWGIRFYMDFYAYSILAVGTALLFGIVLPFNFDRPYRALSLGDFWKSWNITLSSWLRDYIYIPLGGNRCSPHKSMLNVVLTFLVSGLWHGVGFPFVLWGLSHGLMVCLERHLAPFLSLHHQVKKYLYRSILVVVTMWLWQLFRFESYEDIYNYGILLHQTSAVSIPVIQTLCLALVALVVIDSRLTGKIVFEMSATRSTILCEVSVFSLLIMILLLCPYPYTFNFFYFNF